MVLPHAARAEGRRDLMRRAEVVRERRHPAAQRVGYFLGLVDPQPAGQTQTAQLTVRGGGAPGGNAARVSTSPYARD